MDSVTIRGMLGCPPASGPQLATRCATALRARLEMLTGLPVGRQIARVIGHPGLGTRPAEDAAHEDGGPSGT